MNKLLLLGLLLLLSLSSQAGLYHYVNRIFTPVGGTAVTLLQPSAKTQVEVNPVTGNFLDQRVTNRIVFGVDQAYPTYFGTALNVEISVLVKSWDNHNVALADRMLTMNINYDPFGATDYVDFVNEQFEGAYRMEVEVLSITENGQTKTILPALMYVNAEIFVERYESFLTAESPISFIVSAGPLVCSNTTSIHRIAWEMIPGVEEYQLEWLHVNDYNETDILQDKHPSTLEYDFKYNSTRISTSNTYYDLSLLFEKGYVIYRVRGLGVHTDDLTIPLVGVWNLSDRGTVAGVPASNKYKITAAIAHESLMNWQYSATYAEQGKRKEVMNYFDGSLRGRQTVTKINSDNNVIVGETIYDHQGRAGINVLPTPVADCNATSEQVIKFYPNYNKNLDLQAYSREDFDKSVGLNTCAIEAEGMHASSGASNYYSPSNPDKNGAQAYVPDAKLYPFSQVEYTPDNTGRIRRQGGVGVEFQMGSEHESKYYYGQPNQLELDRLFGSEVGNVEHYKKNVVLDANRQSSISYLDMTGKVIATCLAGDTLNNLVALESAKADPVQLTVNAFGDNDNLNKVNIEGDGLVFTSQLLVAYQSEYVFDYDFVVTPLIDPCLPGICIDCVYDLKLELVDECGVNLFPQGLESKVVGKFTNNGGDYNFHGTCTSPQNGTDQEHQSVILPAGNYSLNKILTINEDALAAYLEIYKNEASDNCFKTLEEFQEEELANVDTSGCQMTCESCLADLGNVDEFVAAGKGNQYDYDLRKKECELMCDEGKPFCEVAKDQMLSDMSPGGQYAEFTCGSDVNFNPSGCSLSILNESNALSKNMNPANGAAMGTATWRVPQLVDDYGTHAEYREENGELSRITVTFDGTDYEPEVLNATLVYTDAVTGALYIYPQNLANVKDFSDRFKPSWAQSLLIYHPEYCYYQTCLEYGRKIEESDTYTSQSFDDSLQKTVSFAEAQALGFLDGSGQVTAWFTEPGPGDNRPWDPGATDYFNGTSPCNAMYSTRIRAKFMNYATVDGQVKTMAQMAAILARCYNDFGVMSSPTCDDFGTGSDMELLDREWNTFKGLYISVKQELLRERADCIALRECSSFNHCIGVDPDAFNPVAEGMVGGFSGGFGGYYNAPYWQYSQPCGLHTDQLYYKKVPRFTDERSIPDNTMEEAALTMYQETGQCPTTFAFQNLLSILATTGNLDATPITLNQFGELGNLLFSQNDFQNPGSLPTLVSQATVSTNLITYTWTNTSTGEVYATLQLQKETLPEVTWDEILQVINLTSITDDGEFTALGVYLGEYQNPDYAPQEQEDPKPLKKVVNLRGKFTGINISTCEFEPVCRANELSMDLSILMNGMADAGALCSTSTDISPFNYSSQTVSTFVTEQIENAAGVGQNLNWQYNSGDHQIALYNPGLGINQGLYISYSEVSPDPYTLDILCSIDRFDNMEPTGQNTFTQVGYLADGTAITFTGSLYHQNAAGEKFRVSVGTCEYPMPAGCEGSEYVQYEELKKLISEVLVDKDFTSDAFSVTGLDHFSGIVGDQFPLGVEPTSTYTHVETENYFSNDLKIEAGDCSIDLYNTGDLYPSILSYEDLISVQEFRLLESPATLPVAHQFYFTGTFQVGGVNYTDFIYGNTTCLTLKDCFSCSPAIAIISDPGTDPYGEGEGTGVNVLCDEDESEDPQNPLSGCEGLYLDYVAATQEYNNWASSNGSVQIGSILSYEVFVNQTNCGCMEEYSARLETIKSGVQPIVSSLDLEDYIGFDAFCTEPAQGCEHLPPLDLPVEFPEVPIVDNCVEMEIFQAYMYAEYRYNQYLDSLNTELAKRYIAHCLGVSEHLKYTYKDKSYHYTLYYYDQAGNLIKTIPPQGVEQLATISSYDALSLQIASDRALHKKTVYTNHRMASRYEYNSLNQLVAQATPDTDPMDVFEISLPNGLNARLQTTQIQMLDEQRGYLSGYVALNATTNRGYLYQTSDGGNTWTKINNLVGADLKKVQMLSNDLGFAIGNDGVVLRTLNGGTNWDLIETWNTLGTGMIKHVLDFIFVPVGGSTTNYRGMFVGEKNLIVETGSVNPSNSITFTVRSGGVLEAGIDKTITSVTADNSNFYITVNGLVNGYMEANIYKRAQNAATTASWIAEEKMSVLNLSDVQYYAPGKAYAVGNDGRMYRQVDVGNTTTTAPHWVIVPTGVSYNIKSIAFFSEQEGVALMETAVGQNTLMRTADAGLSWLEVSTQNFNGLYKSREGSLVLAYGKNSALEVVVPMANLPYDNIEIDHPQNGLDITAAWIQKETPLNEPTELKLAFGAAGKLYYSSDAFLLLPVWEEESLPAAGTVTSIEGTYFASNKSVIGAYRLSDNKLYSFHKHPTLNNRDLTIQVITIPATASFGLLSQVGSKIFTVNNTDLKLHFMTQADNLTSLTLGTTGTLAALPSSTGTLSKLIGNGTKFVAINPQGRVLAFETNAGYTAILAPQLEQSYHFRAAWLSNSGVSTSNLGAVVGTDGTLMIKNLSGTFPNWYLAQTQANEDVQVFQATSGGNYLIGGSKGLLRVGQFSQTPPSGTLVSGLISYNGVDVKTTNNLSIKEQYADYTIYDIALRGNKVYAVGSKGLIFYADNYTPTQKMQKTLLSDKDFHGVCFKPTIDKAFVVGTGSTIYEMSALSSALKNDLSVFALKDVHFKDANTGTVIGEKFTIRVTRDGGATWQLVKPYASFAQAPTEDLVRTWTHATDLSLVFGVKQYTINNGVATPNNALPSINALEVSAVNQGKGVPYLHLGVKVANNNYKITKLEVSGTAYPYTFTGSDLASGIGSQVNAIHVFENASYALTGRSGLFKYYSPTNVNIITNGGSTLPTNEHFNDMYFTDHLTGVLVGDNGAYYKTAQTQQSPDGYLTATAWVKKTEVYSSLYDPYQVTAANQIDIKAIAFSKTTNPIIGGNYKSPNFSNTNPQYCYVRTIYDPNARYSARFYYDRLGRLVVSQNTRQYDNKTPGGQIARKYSYMLYDPLGRVVEAGEKTENIASAADPKFRGIFGAYVSDNYNPNVINDDKLLAWIAAAGDRREVTKSFYDKTQLNNLPVDFVADEKTQRKRIVHVTYEELYDGNDQTYDHATHYNYDIHGNVTTLLQDNQKMALAYNSLADQRFKQLEYTYDLVSGNVHRMSVQNGKTDQWHHAYQYDADNRITAVYTSKNTPLLSKTASTAALSNELETNNLWENDAKYFYYAHGPLARTEIGQNELQGVDYVYNLQGWMKGMNATSLDENRDPGMDGAGLGVNHHFAKDVTAFALDYFTTPAGADYQPISSAKTGVNAFQMSIAGSDAEANSFALFNGNIRSMQTTITNPNTREKLPMANGYKYDQLNRIIQSKSYTNANTAANTWGNSGTYDNKYFNWFKYDANGNILNQQRYNSTGAKIDDLTYRYQKNTDGKTLRNRLYHVDEDPSAAANAFTDDIDDQVSAKTINNAFGNAGDYVNQDILTENLKVNGSNNYVYDQEGRLIKDKAEGIENIVWRVDGKIKEITRTAGIAAERKVLRFDYDAMGNRIAKHVINNQTQLPEKTTYYILDATGNTMNVYEHVVQTSSTSASYKVAEKHVYGSSGVGMDTESQELLVAAIVSSKTTHKQGKRNYEISNQLNNVLSVVQDKRKPISLNTTTISEYQVYITSSSDYSPFGVQLDGREFSAENYRYGFQGQEKDNELKGEGNSLNYKYRMHDSRLGRFFARDPLASDYPHNSPYAFSENRVTNSVELEGLEGSDNIQETPAPPSTDTPSSTELVQKKPPKFQLKQGMNGSWESPAFSLAVGGTPRLSNVDKTQAPFLQQFYGDRNYSFYNTPFKQNCDSDISIDEPDNYVQLQGRLKGKLQWSALYMKQKTQPLSNGFKQEANSAIEFGVSIHQTFFRSKYLNISYNLSFTAGPSFASYKFQDINTDQTIVQPKFGFQAGQTNKYVYSGFGATALGRVDFTTLRMATVFVSMNVHHFQGRFDGIETSLGTQKFGYIGSLALNIGTIISVGGRKLR